MSNYDGFMGENGDTTMALMTKACLFVWS